MIFKRRQKRRADVSVAAANAEIASDVMAFLTEQGLPANPVNFELGCLRRNDPKGLVARTVASITLTGDRISQEQADLLVAAYRSLGTGSAAQQPEEEGSARTELRHQTLHLAAITGAAMSATGQFGRDLTERLDEIDRDQHAQPLATSISAMIDRTGDTERRLNVAMAEIDALNSELAAAKNDAARDALTGLVNRRGLQLHLDALASDACTVIAICDIDRFKTINDKHGHQVGDRVIQAVAETIAASCEPHIVARWGGEEFVVLIDGLPLDAAADLIETAGRNLYGRSFRVRDTGEALDPVTFSAGVAIVENGDADTALSAADALLYQAKIDGRDRILTALPTALAA